MNKDTDRPIEDPLSEKQKASSLVADIMSYPPLYTPHFNLNGTNIYRTKIQICIFLPSVLGILALVILSLTPVIMNTTVSTVLLNNEQLNYNINMISNSSYLESTPISAFYQTFYDILNDKQTIPSEYLDLESFLSDNYLTFTHRDGIHTQNFTIPVYVDFNLVLLNANEQVITIPGALHPQPGNFSRYNLTQMHSQIQANLTELGIKKMGIPNVINIFLILPNVANFTGKFFDINISISKPGLQIVKDEGDQYQHYQLTPQDYTQELNYLLHNTMQVTFGQLIQQTKSVFGFIQRTNQTYYIESHERDLTTDYTKQYVTSNHTEVVYGLQLLLRSKVVIQNEKAQLFPTLTLIGSSMAVMLSFWSASTLLIKTKYKNKQAKETQDFDFQRQDGPIDQDHNNLSSHFRQNRKNNLMKYYCDWSYMSQWIYVKDPQKQSRIKLGKRISYMALFERSYTVESQVEDVKQMKLDVKDIQIQRENFKQKLAKLEARLQ